MQIFGIECPGRVISSSTIKNVHQSKGHKALFTDFEAMFDWQYLNEKNWSKSYSEILLHGEIERSSSVLLLLYC